MLLLDRCNANTETKIDIKAIQAYLNLHIILMNGIT